MTFGGRESEKCKGIYQNNLKVRPLRFDTTEMSYCFKFLFFFFASLFSSFEDTERFVMKKNGELFSKRKKKRYNYTFLNQLEQFSAISL